MQGSASPALNVEVNMSIERSGANGQATSGNNGQKEISRRVREVVFLRVEAPVVWQFICQTIRKRSRNVFFIDYLLSCAHDEEHMPGMVLK